MALDVILFICLDGVGNIVNFLLWSKFLACVLPLSLSRTAI